MLCKFCDNCKEMLYDCFFEHNKQEILCLSNIAKKNKLCSYLENYISEFAFNKKHIIHYKRKKFYYYDDIANYNSDDSDVDEGIRCGYDIVNGRYTICEKCMIIGIDYYYNHKCRLPFLRDDSYYFVWKHGRYPDDIVDKHYIKNKYILPSYYVCDYYRKAQPMMTNCNKLLITPN